MSEPDPAQDWRFSNNAEAVVAYARGYEAGITNARAALAERIERAAKAAADAFHGYAVWDSTSANDWREDWRKAARALLAERGSAADSPVARETVAYLHDRGTDNKLSFSAEPIDGRTSYEIRELVFKTDAMRAEGSAADSPAPEPLKEVIRGIEALPSLGTPLADSVWRADVLALCRAGQAYFESISNGKGSEAAAKAMRAALAAPPVVPE